MASQHPRQPRISNEVLEERVTQYFDRTMEAIDRLGAEITKFDNRLERAETLIASGHPATLQTLLNQEIKLGQHDAKLAEIERSKIFKEGVAAGQANTLSWVDKAIIRYLIPIGGLGLAAYTLFFQ